MIIKMTRSNMNDFNEANNCLSQLKIRSNWNGYALIEDIAVADGCRKQGIGTGLLEKAIFWYYKF